MRRLLLAFTVFFTLNAHSVNIDEVAVDETGGVGVGYSALGVSLHVLNFDEDVALENGVGDFAVGLLISGIYRKDYLIGGLGFGFYQVTDNDSFKVYVEDQYGNQELAESSIEGLSLVAEAGVSYPISDKKLFMDLLVGAQSFSASREIDRCEDCPSEDIELSGGMFIKPSLKFFAWKDGVLTIEYQQYLNGDIESAFVLGFMGRY